jgi:hypothetical protein
MKVVFPKFEGAPPEFRSWMTAAKFPNQPNGWSVVLENMISTTDGYEADIRFLVKHAPHNILKDGLEFELFVGAKDVKYVPAKIRDPMPPTTEALAESEFELTEEGSATLLAILSRPGRRVPALAALLARKKSC